MENNILIRAQITISKERIKQIDSAILELQIEKLAWLNEIKVNFDKLEKKKGKN